MSLSRLYLGVHSPADIIAGIIPGTAMLLTYLYIDDDIDAFITSGSYGSYTLSDQKCHFSYFLGRPSFERSRFEIQKMSCVNFKHSPVDA